MGTFSTPRYPAISFLNLSFTPSSLSQPLSTLPQNFITILETHSLDDNKDLINILLEIQHLTSLFNNKTTDLHIPTILRMIASIQYHILYFFHSPGFKHGGVEELCCLGSLIYLEILNDDACARIWGLGSQLSHDINTPLILKLKSCLDLVEIDTPQMRALFLWAILMGGVAVAGTRDRAWFVARLVKVVMEWGIGSWEEARGELRGGEFWWVESIHDGGCREVWDEAVVTMAVLFKL
jgi:hypothetical protein